MSRSRADLARVLGGALAPREAGIAAALLGFEPGTEKDGAPEDTAASQEERGAPAADPVVTPRPDGGLSTGFFRGEAYEDIAPAEEGTRAVPPPEAPLPGDQDTSKRSLAFTPPTPSIASWSRIEPRLRTLLGSARPGRAPDLAALVDRLGRGEVVARVPRLPRRAWTEDLVVWLDRSPRHAAVDDDQLLVLRHLFHLCGAEGLRFRIVASRRRLEALAREETAAAVLVLGDLGACGTEGELDAWRRAGEALGRRGLRAVALCPVGLDRLPASTLRAWAVAAWQTRSLAVPAAPEERRAVCAARAERLLRLVSPASLLQPGLLRALRRLLPTSEADMGTEMDLLGSPAVLAFDASGVNLGERALARLRAAFFAEEPHALQATVAREIERWHAWLPPELLHQEAIQWAGWGAEVGRDPAAPPGDLVAAWDFFRDVEGALLAGGEGVGEWRLYLRAALVAVPPTAFAAGEDGVRLQRLWARAHAGRRVDLPAGVGSEALRAAFEPTEPRAWALRQVGERLHLAPAPATADPAREPSRPGSPVGLVQGASWVLAERRWRPIGEALELAPGRALALETEHARVQVGCWRPEPWILAAGRDRYGLWQAVQLAGVEVRFRWIPPGRFWMGSPEEEEGRWADEGPRHEVTLTRGFWLGETPVTQALYEAVTGENPSRFRTPDRPVERVSWEEARAFCARLEELRPGLDARLPTETEWERACRAGTEGATWRGRLKIRGENDAPGLDDIAWYGGNSGEGFELEDGHDSRDWPNKQHPHTKAGSRPVGQRLPNPWGLYDMLGNVYEWCEDAWEWGRMYDPSDGVDPWGRVGPDRVIRGGSWFSLARLVRAAFRYGDSPGYRGDDLGFRLARGPALRGGAQDGARPARRREGRPGASPAAGGSSARGARIGLTAGPPTSMALAPCA